MPKKLSEKSLELNVGAELLDVLRWRWGMRKTYLRGLTQREEHQEGVDFFAELPLSTRIFAFQFKAPKGQWGDRMPYRFTIQRHQHDRLSALASGWPDGVFYVLPLRRHARWSALPPRRDRAEPAISRAHARSQTWGR